MGRDLLASNFWQARRPLPGFFWDSKTDMNCMRQVLQRAIHIGYNHHIERLMILCNFALLTGLEPTEVNDWFLSTYVDAYEWVMVPNVLGMGLNADGGLVATKPYIASANYINKMSDYCRDCRYAHRKRTGSDACPFNVMYWDFLIRHETTLRSNPRLGPNVLSLRHLDEDERQVIQQSAGLVMNRLEKAS
jgi:deoxyribodipyrimidine photolyase-related protein